MAKALQKVFVRAPYNYDVDAASDEAGLKCEDESLAKQSFLEECDINTILRRFRITGELPEGVRMPTYGDFTDVHDFHSAANAIALAHEAFDQMPAEIRARFHHDPGELVAFCSDRRNLDEARKLGLVPAPTVEVPQAGPAPSTDALVAPSGAPAAVPPAGGPAKA